MVVRFVFWFLLMFSPSFAQMQDPIGIKTDDGNTVYGLQFNFTGLLGIYTSSIPGGVPIINVTLLPSSIAWIQGGNTFGATGIFGTLDNANIHVVTNNRTIMKIFAVPHDAIVHIPADTTIPSANAYLRLNSHVFGDARMDFFANTVPKGHVGYRNVLGSTSIDYDAPALVFRPLSGSPQATLTVSGDLFLSSGIGNDTIAVFPLFMNGIERMRIETDGRITKNNHGVAEMQSAVTTTPYSITTTCPTYTRVSDVVSWNTSSVLLGVFAAQVRIVNNFGATRGYQAVIQRGPLMTCTMPILGGSNSYWSQTNIGTGQSVVGHVHAINSGTGGTENYFICVCSTGTGTQLVEHATLIAWEY